MIDDLKAVIWKEWRELLLQHGSVRRWLLNTLLIVGLIGIFMPLQFGRMIIESVFLLVWMWIPLLTVINTIADSIAGERERHTLETLLASRLPDRAILWGKILVTVAQAWLSMLAGAVLALVTVNLMNRDGEFIMYPVPVAFGVVVVPLLASFLVAGIGVAASSHAQTVRQAYQRMAIPLFAAVMLPSLGLSMLPSQMIADFYSPAFAQNSLGGVMLIIALVLIILDGIILSAVFHRFQRAKLIAD